MCGQFHRRRELDECVMFRGRFIALGDSALRRLRSAKGDPARRRVMEDLEEESHDHVDTDKAWYILYICFLDGNLRRKRRPKVDLETLALLFRGARCLHRGDSYVINAIDAGDVAAVAAALDQLDRKWLVARYHSLDPKYFCAGDYTSTKQQADYTWLWFTRMRAFFDRHCSSGMHIVFSSQF
jgi:hypothetical protein